MLTIRIYNKPPTENDHADLVSTCIDPSSGLCTRSDPWESGCREWKPQRKVALAAHRGASTGESPKQPQAWRLWRKFGKQIQTERSKVSCSLWVFVFKELLAIYLKNKQKEGQAWVPNSEGWHHLHHSFSWICDLSLCHVGTEIQGLHGTLSTRRTKEPSPQKKRHSRSETTSAWASKFWNLPTRRDVSNLPVIQNHLDSITRDHWNTDALRLFVPVCHYWYPLKMIDTYWYSNSLL